MIITTVDDYTNKDSQIQTSASLICCLNNKHIHTSSTSMLESLAFVVYRRMADSPNK
jgi:hypothetical protein